MNMPSGVNKADFTTALKWYERLAISDYKAAKGKYFYANTISGYEGDTDNQVDLFNIDNPDRRMIVRIDETTLDSIIRFDYPHLDPIYEVTIIDGQSDPPLRSCWMYATSYNIEDGTTDDSEFGDRLKVMDLIKLLCRVVMRGLNFQLKVT